MIPDVLSLSNLFAWTLQSVCIAAAAALALRVLPMPSAELRA